MAPKEAPKPKQTRTRQRKERIMDQEVTVTEYMVKPPHGPEFAYQGNTGLSVEEATHLRCIKQGQGHLYKTPKERIALGEKRRARKAEIDTYGEAMATKTPAERAAAVVRALGDNATPAMVAAVLEAMGDGGNAASAFVEKTAAQKQAEEVAAIRDAMSSGLDTGKDE